TIAILILEKLRHQYPQVQFQVLGSDINNAVLDTARAGIYKEYSIRNMPVSYLNKYFRKSGSTYILNDEVKKMVRFMNINLYDSVAIQQVANCDVIFCCNVLIYFDIPSKQQAVSYLYNSLNKGGYLFIGYSESLHGISKAFKLVHLPKAMAYKRE
ncbi:MAG: chemotaxis protein methyltransferase CheR, partial [Bacteroidota bacterium]|nr:chemotaxis protein methyltransferase CheR [Bacteroidota bacterium]